MCKACTWGGKCVKGGSGVWSELIAEREADPNKRTDTRNAETGGKEKADG